MCKTDLMEDHMVQIYLEGLQERVLDLLVYLNQLPSRMLDSLQDCRRSIWQRLLMSTRVLIRLEEMDHLGQVYCVLLYASHNSLKGGRIQKWQLEKMGPISQRAKMSFRKRPTLILQNEGPFPLFLRVQWLFLQQLMWKSQRCWTQKTKIFGQRTSVFIVISHSLEAIGVHQLSRCKYNRLSFNLMRQKTL